jgi:hypothetical protein
VPARSAFRKAAPFAARWLPEKPLYESKQISPNA